MGKNKKKAAHSAKEQKQAERVIRAVFISLVVLAIVMIVGFSFY